MPDSELSALSIGPLIQIMKGSITFALFILWIQFLRPLLRLAWSIFRKVLKLFEIYVENGVYGRIGKKWPDFLTTLSSRWGDLHKHKGFTNNTTWTPLMPCWLITGFPSSYPQYIFFHECDNFLLTFITLETQKKLKGDSKDKRLHKYIVNRLKKSYISLLMVLANSISTQNLVYPECTASQSTKLLTMPTEYIWPTCVADNISKTVSMVFYLCHYAAFLPFCL